MKKSRIGVVLLLAVSVPILLPFGVFSQEIEKPRPAVMRPDAETLDRWVRDFEDAPRAPEDPMVRAGIVMRGELPVGGSLSLLNNIQYTPSARNQGSCGNCWVWAGLVASAVARASPPICATSCCDMRSFQCWAMAWAISWPITTARPVSSCVTGRIPE